MGCWFSAEALALALGLLSGPDGIQMSMSNFLSKKRGKYQDSPAPTVGLPHLGQNFGTELILNSRETDLDRFDMCVRSSHQLCPELCLELMLGKRSHTHGLSCNCMAPAAVSQSLDEMAWERGIWGAAASKNLAK